MNKIITISRQNGSVKHFLVFRYSHIFISKQI